MKLRAAVVCKGLHSAYLAGDVGYADFHVGCVMSRMADGEPVTEIAKSLSEILKVPMFDNMLMKLPRDPDDK